MDETSDKCRMRCRSAATRRGGCQSAHGPFRRDGRFAGVYFDPKSGNELSAVLGCSYNCANQFTYQNASSSTWHEAPRIVGEAAQAISAGCGYQMSCARRFGDRLGRFGSRAIGAWPQLDYSPEFRKTRRSVFAAPADPSKIQDVGRVQNRGSSTRFSAQPSPHCEERIVT